MEYVTEDEFEETIINLEKMINARLSISADGGIPSGIIAIFDSSCPSGWARISGWDGKFIVGKNVYGGTGGSAPHNHGPGTLVTVNCVSHQHSDDPPGTYTSYGVRSERRASAGATNLCEGVHRHYRNYGALATGTDGVHNHNPIGGTTGNTSGDSQYPLYYKVYFCKRS